MPKENPDRGEVTARRVAPAAELACTFARATGERLLDLERLILSLPVLFEGELQELDLAYRSSIRYLVTVARFSAGNDREEKRVRERLGFWAARVGGRTTALATLGEAELAAFRMNISSCELRVVGLLPGGVFEGSERLFTEAGAPAGRKRSIAEPQRLLMDATGPGWQGASYDEVEGRLFLAAPLSPPLDDVVPLSVRVPGEEHPVRGSGRVVLVRSAEEAAPGQPAGFALDLAKGAQALREALKTLHAGRKGDDARAAPRFPVGGRVEVTPTDSTGSTPEPAPAVTEAPPSSQAVLTYASDQDLRKDFIENLSQGGAFVRRALPCPVGTPVSLRLTLPSGLNLTARAVVAFVNSAGMGLKFELDPEAKELLDGAIAQISGRPRRALVVDDDAATVRGMADALVERGFEVLTAGDCMEGLRILSEELLALDLLVTEVFVPTMQGESFVTTIRRAGGEADLAIVVVSAHLDPDLEARLETCGADAVIDKGLGSALVAKAADAVLDRKRSSRTH